MCTKNVLALLFGLSVSAVVYAAQSVPSAGAELPTIMLDSPVKITHSVRIAPGVYRLPVPDGGAVIEVAAGTTSKLIAPMRHSNDCSSPRGQVAQVHRLLVCEKNIVGARRYQILPIIRAKRLLKFTFGE